ncbi:MAG: kelch repeat-containing protein [Candidatus Promineifilaceae bacterium]
MAEVGEPLSARELVVLERLAEGSTNREIAKDLSISHNTVKVHLSNIFKKLDVSSRTEAITVAIQKGYITVESNEPLEQPPIGPDVLSSGSITDEEQENQSPPAAAPTHWRAISIVLLLIVVLLIGVVFGPRLTGNGSDSSDEPTAPTQNVMETEPMGDSNWHIAQPMPDERAGMALVAVGLDLFQIGGEVKAGVVNLVDIFDTASGIWRSAASKPTAVADANAAILFGEIFVPGGRLADGQPTSVVEAYSPANNAWRPVTPLPIPLAGAVVLAEDGMLYVIGGWDGQDYVVDGFVYDPGSEQWNSIDPMSIARSKATGGVLSNGLYVIGGENTGGALDSCEVYHLDTDEWEQCPEMNARRTDAGAAVLGNDRLYVFGGGTDSGIDFGEVYSVKDAAWSEFEMPMLVDAEPWRGLGVTNVETRIYAIGGRQGGEILADSYIFAPFIHQTFLPAVGGDR